MLAGRYWLLHAFDVARSISLAACRELLPTREVAPSRRPEWPQLFGLDERPLVWPLEPVEVDLAGRTISLQPNAIIYDFGNVSVALGGRFEGSGDDWRELAIALRDRRDVIEELAREICARFVERSAIALDGLGRAMECDTYTVMQIDRVPAVATDWLEDNRLLAAQMLLAERSALSAAEIQDLLQRRVSYTVDDVVVVDAASALIIDDEFEDTLAVLDYANCERQSLRILDEELDKAVSDAGAMSRTRGWRWRGLLSPWGRDLRRLAQLTFDATAEFETSENAIKLTGDYYLARIYRLAVERFDLPAFREGVHRKLSSLWSIQHVFLDRATSRRSEALEWIIILLIAVEIVQALR